MPLVSILMPVFNREDMVGDAIRSIQNQSVRDWELIILDDASTDQTLEVCRRFEESDKRIRAIANDKNVGVGKARNRLTSYATGKYIANHDSDDISVPDRLKMEVELLESKPEIALVSGLAEWVDQDGKTLGCEPKFLCEGRQYPQDRNEVVRILFQGCEVSNPTCLFRRSLIDEIPDPYGTIRCGEDWYFFVQVAHRHLIWGIHEVLVKMRRGKNHAHIWKDYEEGLWIGRELVQFTYRQFKDNPESPINYSLYRKTMGYYSTKLGRTMGGWKGYSHILRGVFYDPSSEYSWRSLWEFSGRALKKARRAVAT